MFGANTGANVYVYTTYMGTYVYCIIDALRTVPVNVWYSNLMMGIIAVTALLNYWMVSASLGGYVFPLVLFGYVDMDFSVMTLQQTLTIDMS